MDPWSKLLIGGYEVSHNSYFLLHGVYVYTGTPPEVCPVCFSNAFRYHAHGSFDRWMKIFDQWEIKKVCIRKPRLLCLICEHTFSLHPPDVPPYKSFSYFLTVVLLWNYLISSTGLYNGLDPEISEGVSERTVQRYLRSAMINASETQQFIREVLIERIEPRPVEDLCTGGLSPPEDLCRKRLKEPGKAWTLWQALYMLREGAEKLSIDPRSLLAWASIKCRQKRRNFLV